MGNEIDNRLVEMQFDNKQFESGVQTSIKSIENLKKGLNFDASVKSLSELDRAGKSFSLAGIAQGVEAIAGKFTALGIIGVTALENIANSAINAGKRLVSALTVDPIRTGLNEYETKINAIQTILTNTASKGTTLDEVNATLAELNTYADKTIYNFAEMTRNIGTFTAAGIGLKDSATAIKGIANLAAGSGSNAQQASTAMYQLSQALAAGSVKLMDWNSVVNAGMGGELFQKALKETAKGMGKVIDESIPFRESLQSGWITSDVLIKTLEKFANDPMLVQAATQVKTFTQLFDTMKESVQSGWAVSWENIIGNKDEAAKFLTSINDSFNALIGPATDARNATLKFWHDNGGRDALIEALSSAFKGLTSVIAPIKQAFEEIFPPMTGEKLVEITKAVRDLLANFKIGDKTAANLKSTFKGLFAILDIGKQLFSALAKGLGGLINYLLPAGDGILSFTGSIGEWLVSLDEAIKKSGIFNVAIEKIGNFLRPIADAMKKAITTIIDVCKAFGDVDTTGIEKFSDRVKARLEPISKIIDSVKSAFAKMGEALKKYAPIFYKLAGVIGDAFKHMQEGIVNALDNADFKSIFDIVNGGLFATILFGLKKFINSLTDITDGAGGFLEGITGILDGVKGSLEAYQSQLKAGTLLKIAIAIGILAAALIALSLVDSDKLASSLAAMSVMFVQLFGSMGIMSKIMASDGFKGIGSVTRAMISLSVAILILSFAMANLAKLDWEGIAKGLTAVAVLSATLVASAKLLSGNTPGLIKGSLGLILFATAVTILTDSVVTLGKLDLKALTKGLVGVGVLVTELALFMKVTDLDGMGIRKGVGFIALAAAIAILTESVKKFSELNPEGLIRGLSAVAIVLAEVAIFVNVTGNAKSVITTAIGLTILGAAMVIFAQAVTKMSKMSWEEIAKGMTAMAGSLAFVTAAIKLLPKNMVAKAVGLIGVATSLVILSNALSTMGKLSWEEVARGLLALAGSMTILAVGLNSMKTALPGAAAMLVVSAALAIFAPILKSLGSMSLSEIGKGLLALAGTFTILGVAGLLLKPVIPTLIGLGVAVTLIGVGCLAAGVGLMAFAAGLASLAIGGSAAAAAIVLIVSGIIGLIPYMLEKLGEGIIAFAGVIKNGAPAIAEAFVALVEAGVIAMVGSIPLIAEGLLQLVLGILSSIEQYTPQIVDSLFNIVIEFLNKITEKLPALIKAGADLLGAFLKGIFDAMGGYKPETLFKTLGAITMLIACFAMLAAAQALAKKAIIATGAMIIVLGLITVVFVAMSSLPVDTVQAIATSLSEVLLTLAAAMLILSLVPIPAAISAVAGLGIFVAGLTVILAALGALKQIPGFEWLIGEGGALLGQLGTAIGSFAGNIVAGFMTGVSSSFPKIAEDLSEFMVKVQPFIDGAKGIDEGSMNGVKALAETILILTASSLLDSLTSWLTGGSSMTKFGEEIAKFAPYFLQYYNTIKGVDGSVVEASANAARALAQFAANIPNTGGLWGKIAGENSLTQFAQELVYFGPKLKAYADSIKGLDGDVVVNSANAAKALAEMANNLPNSGGVVGWFTGENNLSTFASELMIFGPKLKAYADSVKGLDGNVALNSAVAAKALAEMAANLPNQGGVVAWFTGDNNLSQFADELMKFGPKLMAYAESVRGLDGNVVSTSTYAALAMAELANNLPNSGGVASWFSGDNTLSKFGENLRIFGVSLYAYYSAVKRIELSQFAGVVTQVANLVNLARGISEIDSSSMKKFGEGLSNIGYAGVQKFVDAFDSSYEKVTSAVSSMLDVVISNGITARVTDFFTAGENVIEGFVNGIRAKIAEAAKWATELAKNVLLATKNYLGIHSPSKVFQDEVGAMIVEGTAKGIKDNTPKAQSAAEKMAESVFNTAREWIDERKYYNKISLEEELYVWQEIQKKYAEGTEERKRVDREVYRVESEMRQDAFNDSVNWIDEEKYYKRMSLLEELAAWQRVQSRYVAGSEERKKADREVYRLEQQISQLNKDTAEQEAQIREDYNDRRKALEDDYYAKTKEINDKLKADIDSLNKAYEDAVQNRTDSLYSSYGLFDKVDTKKVSGDTLLTNLEGQVTAFESWQKNLSELAAKGIDEGLIKELRDMGPESAAQIEALNQLSSEKLNKYVDLWRIKHEDAKNQAISELEDMRIATSQKIAELTAQSQIDLAANQTMWREQMAALEKQTDIQLTQLNNTWKEQLGLLSANTEAQVISITGNIATAVSGSATGVETAVQALVVNVQNIIQKPDWSALGENIVDGIVVGIQKAQSRAINAAVAMAVAAYRAACAALGIRSPSKMFEKVGMYSALGFANGLSNYSGVVTQAATDVGNNAVNSISAVVSKINDAINGNMDLTPTIRPVLDLSSIQSGAKTVSAILGSGIQVIGAVNKASTVAANGASGGTSGDQTINQTPQPTEIKFTQNNYSPKPLSRIDIYRNTKNQLSVLEGLVNA